MSEWKKVKLGEVCDFINGGAWSDKEYVSEGIPVLKVTNCKNSGFSLSEISYLPFSSKQKYSQNELQLHDVIIATVGSHPNLVNSSAGRSAIVNSFVTGFFLNQNAVCIRTKDANILNQLYFGYYSKYYLFQNYIQMRGKGAANQMRIAISSIKAYPMPLPPIEHQSYIATILSRYDSLIENYQKQIKLLEEAAQRLYKEWFIDLRFPGHESTKIVDGVPEGWEKKSVDTIYNIKYGKNLSTKLITATGVFPVYGANGVIGYYDKANCNEQVVLITSRGNGSGDVLMTYHKEAFITNNSFVVTPAEGYEYCKLPFTFQFLRMANFRAVRTGAAQPQLTNQSIHTVDVILPSKSLIEKFCNATIGMNEAIIKYREQLRLLTEARDRLLPKLMSGELTIEARAEEEADSQINSIKT